MLNNEENKQFDILIPVGPNEISIINNVVKNIQVNVINYNKIYLLSSDSSLSVQDCITINENIFPFTKEDIKKYTGASSRVCWIYQQLLKLYSTSVLTECLDNILIIDADVYVLNKLNFMQQSKPIFTVGYEHTPEYHIHSKKLHPSIDRIYNEYSGVSHHMMLNKKFMKELFYIVENYHNADFLKVFLNSLDVTDPEDIKCSEYEIYFNFMCKYHRNEVVLRELRWSNVPYLISNMEKSYDYVSVPKWLGTR